MNKSGAPFEADPDAHPTDENFWTTAKLVMPRPKETITIRLDADVVEWFRGRGKDTRLASTRSCALTCVPAKMASG